MAVSSGTSDADFEKTKAILAQNERIKYICIDVANGYSQFFVDFVKRARKEWPDRTIMAGNVVTAEMVEELILAGADIIKVGIGPGSVCTTRKKTVSRSHPPSVNLTLGSGSWVSAAECSTGVCERCSRTGRTYHIGRRVHMSWRCVQSIRC